MRLRLAHLVIASITLGALAYGMPSALAAWFWFVPLLVLARAVPVGQALVALVLASSVAHGVHLAPLVSKEAGACALFLVVTAVSLCIAGLAHRAALARSSSLGTLAFPIVFTIGECALWLLALRQDWPPQLAGAHGLGIAQERLFGGFLPRLDSDQTMLAAAPLTFIVAWAGAVLSAIAAIGVVDDSMPRLRRERGLRAQSIACFAVLAALGIGSAVLSSRAAASPAVGVALSTGRE